MLTFLLLLLISRTLSIRSLSKVNSFIRLYAASTPNAPTTVSPRILQQNKLLCDLWSAIASPNEEFPERDFRLQDYGLRRQEIAGFIQHFQNCKDCAADQAFLMATQNEANEDILRLSNVHFPLLSEEDDEEWGMFDPALLGDEEQGAQENIFPVEPSDDLVLLDSKQWVRAIIADFGVCPFTMDPDKAGIPQGGVRYTISRTHNVDEAFAVYWAEVQALLQTSERDMSTILLIFPELELFGDYELFETYCECLTDALCSR